MIPETTILTRMGAMGTGAQAVLMVQFGKEASQTRDYFVAGTRRFARLAQILRCAKNACFRMTIKLHHYPAGAGA